MTIEKAITLIEHCAKTHARYDRIEIKDALKLGIEALKREQQWRQRWPHQSHLPFPGETKED